MLHDYVLWFVLFGYAVHVLEERMLMWLPWAKKTFHLPLSWDDFYVANAVVIVTALCALRRFSSDAPRDTQPRASSESAQSMT